MESSHLACLVARIVAHLPHLACGRHAQPADHIDRRRFARTIGSQQAKNLALLNSQREVINSAKGAKVFAQIDHLYGGASMFYWPRRGDGLSTVLVHGFCSLSTPVT